MVLPQKVYGGEEKARPLFWIRLYLIQEREISF